MSRFYRISDLHPHERANKIIPELTEDEYLALRESIEENRMLSPVWLSQRGGVLRVLDGRHRIRAAQDLGWTEVPGVLIEGLDEEKEIALACEAAGSRRNLTREQRREYVAAILRDRPGRSNLQIGRWAGVSDKTVAAVRAELEERSEIPNADTRTDSAGREQPATKPRAPTVADNQARQKGTKTIPAFVEIPGTDTWTRNPAIPEEPTPDAEPEPVEPEPAVEEPVPSEPARKPAPEKSHARPIDTHRLTVLVTAAIDAAHAAEGATGEQIKAIIANDLMLAGLRKARDLIDRIIRQHSADAKSASA